MLRCLDVEKDEKILDVGCGYGPIGLSLVKAYGAQATMVDINNRALDLAQQNAVKTMFKRLSSSPIFMSR